MSYSKYSKILVELDNYREDIANDIFWAEKPKLQGKIICKLKEIQEELEFHTKRMIHEIQIDQIAHHMLFTLREVEKNIKWIKKNMRGDCDRDMLYSILKEYKEFFEEGYKSYISYMDNPDSEPDLIRISWHYSQ